VQRARQQDVVDKLARADEHCSVRGAKQICRSSRFAVETSISGLRPD
jgi:hypothetical protein